MQIFQAMDNLIMMSEKHIYFRKRKDHLTSNWIHVLWKYFSNHVSQRYVQKHEKNWNNSGCINVFFVNL